MTNAINGFFAYPSYPPAIPEIISSATEELNLSQATNLKQWEQCQIGGKIILTEICKTIDQSRFFCADLTGLNPNVLFELGYAIATNKRIWAILDVTRVKSKRDFDRFRILTTLGYRPYTNSRDIINAFYKDRPYEDLASTVFDQEIKPTLAPSESKTLFYLKSRHDNEASIRLSDRLDKIPLELVVDDPAESSIQPLAWYGKKAYSASGIVCHLTDPERDDAGIHNARHSLIAGIAHGFKKPLLMLSETTTLSPVDYRDILKNYATASEALTHLDSWLRPIVTEAHQSGVVRKQNQDQLRLSIELKTLELGEHIAENEATRLVDNYYVDTSAYRAALAGQDRIFVGRKGAGKTATFLKLASTLRSDKRNLVCVIKPAAYEVQSIARLLSGFKERDSKGFAVESLWKFLLLTEMANVLCSEIELKDAAARTDEELALTALIAKMGKSAREDFSIRLESCIRDLLDVAQTNGLEATVHGFRTAISEKLHKGILRDLRIKLIRALHNRKRIAILVDNLDKAWDQHSDLATLADVLFGLLRVGRQMGDDFKPKGQDTASLELSMAIFLRSDIFFRVMQSAREPDKLTHYPVAWADPESLLHVIEERYTAGSDGDRSPEELWSKFFCEQVKGVPTRNYLVSRIFPRPRDLLFFINTSIAIAVSRGHSIVDGDDILKAEIEYSKFALESISVENSLGDRRIDEMIYEFVGSPAIIDEVDLRRRLSAAGVDGESLNSVREYLCRLGFLGVEVGPNEFRFAEDPDDFRKNIRLAENYFGTEGVSRRFKINTPFWAYLEITDSNAILPAKAEGAG
jgi:hypothetical protein